MVLVKGTNCGFVTTAPTVDPNESAFTQDNTARAFKDIAPIGAVIITEIGIWIDNATEAADIEVGIYSHDAGDDEPDNLLGSTTFAKGLTSGWKKATGLNIPVVAGITYWIGAQLDDTATDTDTDRKLGIIEADRYAEKLVQASLPNPWGDSSRNYDNRYIAIYAVWEEAPIGFMTTNTKYWG